MNILAIDPGSEHSAYVIIDAPTRQPVEFGKVTNSDLLWRLANRGFRVAPTHYVIEMIASYGMPVGREVFETCVWIGRLQQAVLETDPRAVCELVYRQPVKLHHCHSAKAKDANITQALVDRFAAGEPNRGKGTKAAPGWFHGFSADVWQAYALAVYAADDGAAAAPSFGNEDGAA